MREKGIWEILAILIVLVMIGSGIVVSANTINNASISSDSNVSLSSTIIDKIISIIKSIFSGDESDASLVDAHANVTEVKVELIRSFSNEEEFEKYIDKTKGKQVVVLSEPLRKIVSEKEIKFYDSKGNLSSTYSCKLCEVFQSPNGKYIGVLETNEDFIQFNFTLLNTSGQVLWHKDNFHPTTEGSVCQVYISNDGKNIIKAVMQDIEAPYSILFYDLMGNAVKEYREHKDAEKFDFDMAVSELSPSGEYLIIAGPDGIFAFDWKGNLVWEYDFSPIYMRVAHEIYISPDGKYIVVKVDEHPTEEEMNVCLYFLDRNGKFIGKYSKEYLHGIGKFSEDGKSLFIATHTGLFLFDASNAKKIWSYQFEKYTYIRSLDISPDGKWIALVRATSETEKTIYLFSNFGEKVWAKRFEGEDLGDLNQPVVDFVDNSNKLSVKFPNKILLFEVIKEGN